MLCPDQGGPFVMHQLPGAPTCIGELVANGATVQLNTSDYPVFGLTFNGTFILGFVDPGDVPSYNFQQLLTGFGWLLYNGTVQVGARVYLSAQTSLTFIYSWASSRSPPTAEKSPRERLWASMRKAAC
jgi:hypothetical protein